MFPLFNALLAPFLPLLALYTLYRRFIQHKSAASFAAQWGVVTLQMRDFGRESGPKIWLHAVSVGETVAARPIAAAFKAEIPGVTIALSSTTDSGHQLAQTLLKKGEVDAIFYFPLDLTPLQNRVLNALRPDAICFVETELWPNLLHLARKRGVPTFLVNGRVSDNLLKTAPRLGPLWKWMSGNLTQWLMRGEDDAARLQTLGVSRQKIVVTGDVKLENPPLSSQELREKWRAELGLQNEPIFVAGSTHPGEEAAILRWATQIPGLKIALAPRHIERTDEVAALIRDAGFAVVRRSEGKIWAKNAVFLLDTIGELGDFYAVCDVAFVGGSLIERGGHNLLEPVLRGAPVVFGPFVMNFGAAAELVLKNELGTQISGESELKDALRLWMKAENRADFAARVEMALQAHRGAARRMAQQVRAKISEPRA